STSIKQIGINYIFRTIRISEYIVHPFETIVAAIPAKFPFMPILANFFAALFMFLAFTSSKTAAIILPVKKFSI
ncbi:hypothetical protein, partial [Staphylococcus aureus]|uniref:hypothetical protein n=1 Tax=Staphylococcus aureus TaxID=1280 RepID=UPI001CDA407B